MNSMHGLAYWPAVLAVAASLVGCGRGIDRDSMRADPRNAYIEARTTLMRATDEDGYDEAWAVRSNAVEALAQTEGASAGSVYLEGLRDKDQRVFFSAAMAVGECQYAPAKERLVAMMGDSRTNPSVRCAIIYALYRMGDYTFMEELGRQLFDRSADARANAAMVMGRIGSQQAVKPLMSLLRTEQNPIVLLNITESLAALGDPSSYRRLQTLAQHSSFEEKMVAVAALGRLHSTESKSFIAKAMASDQYPMLRIQAATALARMGDDRGFNLAVDALVHPTEMLRRYFGSKSSIEIAPELAGQLQALGAQALGKMNHKAAVDPLLEQLSSESPLVRIAAAKAILELLDTQSLAAAMKELPVEPAPVPADGAPEASAPPAAPDPMMRYSPAKD